MDTAPLRPAFHSPAHGATALGTDSDGRPTNPSRPHHRLRRRTGDALRAVRVFAGAAFGVVVLGTGTATATSTSTDGDTAPHSGTDTCTGTAPRSGGDGTAPYHR